MRREDVASATINDETAINACEKTSEWKSDNLVDHGFHDRAIYAREKASEWIARYRSEQGREVSSACLDSSSEEVLKGARQARMDTLWLLVRFATGTFYEIEDLQLRESCDYAGDWPFTDIANIWELREEFSQRYDQHILEHFGVLSFSCEEVLDAVDLHALG